MTIDIIGAGIGGLTTAICLQQLGYKVRVYERAEVIEPVGAGIILASNAMQVFDKLGLKQEISDHGNSISSLNITRENLEPLSKVDLSSFEKKFGVKNTAIHRGTLQKILLDQLNPASIYLDHELSSISKTEAGNILEFTNGKRLESTLLIGADGIHSVIRAKLFEKTEIRMANQICWRGVADFQLPEKFQHELNESWGNTGRFGFVQIAPSKVYWYALKTGDKNKFSDTISIEHFENFNPLVTDIIRATDQGKIHTAEISDFKPINQWYNDNVCLIGDAAHAATPNMGQGACQAIEDAYVLSKCIQKYNQHQAFNKFQTLRKPKAHQVVNASWRIGKLSHWKNPIAIQLRNTLIKLAPASINKKQLETLFKLPQL